MAVEMTLVVDEPGMMDPSDGPSVSVHGTTMVVSRKMVVTGAVYAGGAAVMVRVLTPVMMAGFSGT